MFYKYLISIIIFTIYIQATPKLFEFYGKQLEAFNDNCKVYRKNKKISSKIKKQCKKYISTVNKVFKYGYKLDTSVERDTINLDKAEEYNILLHNLEDKKDTIIHLINLEISKATKQSDIKYFKFLLSSFQVEIEPYQYHFMEKFKDSFKKYPKYIKYKEKLLLKREEDLKLKSPKYSSLDMLAFNKYKRTQVFQDRSKMNKTDLYADTKVLNHPTKNIIDWDATLKSITEQTDDFALLGAVAKGYHTDYIYMILSLSLHDINHKEIYRTPNIKRKMYINKRNYIHHSSSYPKRLVFSYANINFSQDLDGASYTNQVKENIYNKTQNDRYISTPILKHPTQVDTLANKRSKVLTARHLSNLTIDFGIISCWERDTGGYLSKYIVIDRAGTIYAVNGKARGHAKKAGWIDAKTILKPNGDYRVFSNIIKIAIKNGCSNYCGL